jgi:hypothetical protein
MSIFIITYKYLVFKRNSLLNIEKDKKILFNEYCGGHFDSLGILDIFHNNILTTRVSIYNEFMVISYRRKILLQYNEIIDLIILGAISQDPYKPSRDWKKLSISHTKEDISKKIFLYLHDCEKVKLLIEERINSPLSAVLVNPIS